MKKYDLTGHIKLNHKVLSANWVESLKVWNIEYENEKKETKTEQFRFVVLGTGPLNRPNIPKGITNFLVKSIFLLFFSLNRFLRFHRV